MDASGIAARIAACTQTRPRIAGAGSYMVRCPAHDDIESSLHVSRGKSQSVLVKCLAGCQTLDVLTAAGLRWSDLCKPIAGGAGVTDEYHYVDEDGRHLYTVCRVGQGKGKRFFSYHFDEHGGLVRDARGVRRVLYHLPEVITAIKRGEVVYLCEGEKDADCLRNTFGVKATTNAFGAAAWAKDSERWGYAEQLRGAQVVIVQHRDAAGRARSKAIRRSLGSVAASVRVVQSVCGNDAYDHVQGAYELADLVPVAESELVFEDDGTFAALPNIFLDVVDVVGLQHLDYHVLIQVARHSVRREHQQTVWQTIPCPSSWLARICSSASRSAVRKSLQRLCRAGILIDQDPDASTSKSGMPRRLAVNPHYDEWQPVGATAPRVAGRGCPLQAQPLHSARTPIQEQTLHLREEGVGGRESQTGSQLEAELSQNAAERTPDEEERTRALLEDARRRLGRKIPPDIEHLLTPQEPIVHPECTKDVPEKHFDTYGPKLDKPK